MGEKAVLFQVGMLESEAKALAWALRANGLPHPPNDLGWILGLQCDPQGKLCSALERVVMALDKAGYAEGPVKPA